MSALDLLKKLMSLTERRGSLYLTMQEARFPLLRLGRFVERNEVRLFSVTFSLRYVPSDGKEGNARTQWILNTIQQPSFKQLKIYRKHFRIN